MGASLLTKALRGEQIFILLKLCDALLWKADVTWKPEKGIRDLLVSKILISADLNKKVKCGWYVYIFFHA